MAQPSLGLSDPSTARQRRRPDTASTRPSTSHRRLDTARPETSTSSVGEIPQQTFFPDNDEEDDEDLGEVYESDDEEESDVFAFERPQTAAVRSRHAAPSGTWLEHTSGREPIKPIVRLATSKSRTLTTADTGRTVSFGFDIHDDPASARQRHDPADMDVLLSLPYEAAPEGSPLPTHNLNASAYNPRSEGWGGQRPSVVSDTLVGMPSTAHSKNSRVLSDSVQQSTDTIDGYPRPEASSFDHKHHPEGIELAAYRRRPETEVSWNISELHGATTIPDGITTKGDGLGNIHPKWAADDANSSAGGNRGEDLEEDSPFPEVRASVSNIDDPDLPGEMDCLFSSLRKAD